MPEPRRTWPLGTLLTVDGALLIVVESDGEGFQVRQCVRVFGSVEGRGDAYTLTEEQEARTIETEW